MIPSSLPSPSHYLRTSDGQLYLRQHVKNIFIPSGKAGFPPEIIHRFVTRRCLPDGSILPRIRMSKKTRIALRRHLCSTPSSTVGSAVPQSTSPA